MTALFCTLLLLPFFKNGLAPDKPEPVFSGLKIPVYRCEKGKIMLRSEAPLEVIEARSTRLRGAIDVANNTFAWSVEVNSFEGFNNPLQREHFNENYMETKNYPKATFTGKIIEQVDFGQDGNQTVRAKGKLTIHGVAQERIIKSQVAVKNGKITVKSAFTVLLSDHSISIPKIVYQKISEEVAVSMEAELEIRN